MKNKELIEILKKSSEDTEALIFIDDKFIEIKTVIETFSNRIIIGEE